MLDNVIEAELETKAVSLRRYKAVLMLDNIQALTMLL